jgi:hypothetical protein
MKIERIMQMSTGMREKVPDGRGAGDRYFGARKIPCHVQIDSIRKAYSTSNTIGRKRDAYHIL